MTIIPPVAPSRFTFSGNTPASIPAPSPKTVWQHAVAQSDLPFHTKGILLIVATEWMGADGGSCFPTEAQIMERTGVSRPCLTRHMRIAVENGFIERWRWGHGNGNRRYNYRAIIPGQPAPTVEMGNEVSYLPAEMGNEVSDHEPCPINNQNQQREPQPEPASSEPKAVTPNGAPSGFVIQTRKAIAEDWALPDDYRAWATEHRPDLTDRLDAIADGFRDYHLSKGTRSANWQAEWRRWIHRERAVKPTQSVRAAPQPERRYPTVEQEKALDEANLAAMRASDERRIAMLIANGIDPITGLKARPPIPAAASEQIPPAPLETAPPQPAPEPIAEPPAAASEREPSMPAHPAPIPTVIRNTFNPTASHAPPKISREQTALFAEMAAAGKSLAEIKALLGLTPAKSTDSDR